MKEPQNTSAEAQSGEQPLFSVSAPELVPLAEGTTGISIPALDPTHTDYQAAMQAASYGQEKYDELWQVALATEIPDKEYEVPLPDGKTKLQRIRKETVITVVDPQLGPSYEEREELVIKLPYSDTAAVRMNRTKVVRKSGWTEVAELRNGAINSSYDPQTNQLNVTFYVGGVSFRPAYQATAGQPVIKDNAIVQQITAQTPKGTAVVERGLYYGPEHSRANFTPEALIGEHSEELTRLITELESQQLTQHLGYDQAIAEMVVANGITDYDDITNLLPTIRQVYGNGNPKFIGFHNETLAAVINEHIGHPDIKVSGKVQNKAESQYSGVGGRPFDRFGEKAEHTYWTTHRNVIIVSLHNGGLLYNLEVSLEEMKELFPGFAGLFEKHNERLTSMNGQTEYTIEFSDEELKQLRDYLLFRIETGLEKETEIKSPLAEKVRAKQRALLGKYVAIRKAQSKAEFEAGIDIRRLVFDDIEIRQLQNFLKNKSASNRYSPLFTAVAAVCGHIEAIRERIKRLGSLNGIKVKEDTLEVAKMEFAGIKSNVRSQIGPELFPELGEEVGLESLIKRIEAELQVAAREGYQTDVVLNEGRAKGSSWSREELILPDGTVQEPDDTKFVMKSPVDRFYSVVEPDTTEVSMTAGRSGGQHPGVSFYMKINSAGSITPEQLESILTHFLHQEPVSLRGKTVSPMVHLESYGLSGEAEEKTGTMRRLLIQMANDFNRLKAGPGMRRSISFSMSKLEAESRYQVSWESGEIVNSSSYEAAKPVVTAREQVPTPAPRVVTPAPIAATLETTIPFISAEPAVQPEPEVKPAEQPEYKRSSFWVEHANIPLAIKLENVEDAPAEIRLTLYDLIQNNKGFLNDPEGDKLRIEKLKVLYKARLAMWILERLPNPNNGMAYASVAEALTDRFIQQYEVDTTSEKALSKIKNDTVDAFLKEAGTTIETVLAVIEQPDTLGDILSMAGVAAVDLPELIEKRTLVAEKMKMLADGLIAKGQSTGGTITEDDVTEIVITLV